MSDRYNFYALDRDRAKQLFAARAPEALDAFIAEVADDPAIGHFAIGGAALEVHHALAGGEEPDAGEYPLNHAVLGGRELTGENLQVILKRPDMAGHIATALANADIEPEQRDVVNQLQAFYEDAAQGGCAVILVVG